MDTMNQLARELTDAISAALAADARVEACREKAKTAGFDMRVSLEAVIGFVNRADGTALEKVSARKTTARLPSDMTATDRRFLKSLRIAADATAEKEVE